MCSRSCTAGRATACSGRSDQVWAARRAWALLPKVSLSVRRLAFFDSSRDARLLLFSASPASPTADLTNVMTLRLCHSMHMCAKHWNRAYLDTGAPESASWAACCRSC